VRGAARAADGDGEPPRELIWYWRTKRFGLPHGRGWLDEPAGLLDRMVYLDTVYQTWRTWRRVKRWGAWAREHPEDWALVQHVMRLLKQDGSDDG